MISSWVWFALLTALFSSFMPLVSEYFKVRAIHFLFWLRCFSVLALLPFMFFIEWPDDPLYYVFTILASVLFAYSDVFTMGVAAKNGAGVVSRIQPLAVVGTFFIWTMITPSLLQDYINDPLRTVGILVAFCIGIFFALRMRHCEISRNTLKVLWSAILVSSLAIVFSKTAMDHSPLHSGVFCYPFLQGIVCIISYLVAMNIKVLSNRIQHFDAKSVLFSRRVLLAGLCAATVHLSASIAKYYGISTVENPAYVTMIGLTSPLWILLVYRFVGRKEEADVLSGLGVVAAVALLIVVTQF